MCHPPALLISYPKPSLKVFITSVVPFIPIRGVFRTWGEEPKNYFLSNFFFRVLDELELYLSRT